MQRTEKLCRNSPWQNRIKYINMAQNVTLQRFQPVLTKPALLELCQKCRNSRKQTCKIRLNSTLFRRIVHVYMNTA